MQTVDPNDPRLKGMRPAWGLAILTLPIVGVVIVAVGYGSLFLSGTRGRAADGPRVEWTFEGCPEARPLIEARVADMGLEAAFGDAPGGFVAELVLPGDPEVAAGVPATLTMPGALEVRGANELLVTNADLTDASVRVDLLMYPSTLLRLTPEAAERVKKHVRDLPKGELLFYVDGVRAGRQDNQNPVSVGEIELGLDEGDDKTRMHRAAALSVVLDHGPLPCPVTVR